MYYKYFWVYLLAYFLKGDFQITKFKFLWSPIDFGFFFGYFVYFVYGCVFMCACIPPIEEVSFLLKYNWWTMLY